jgi:hypothetical protein
LPDTAAQDSIDICHIGEEQEMKILKTTEDEIKRLLREWRAEDTLSQYPGVYSGAERFANYLVSYLKR